MTVVNIEKNTYETPFRTNTFEEREETNLVVTIPETVLHQLRWEVGDSISLQLTDDGSVLITKE